MADRLHGLTRKALLHCMHGDRVSERAPQCTGVLTAGVRVPLVCQSETEGARKEGEGMESGCGGGGWAPEWRKEGELEG